MAVFGVTFSPGFFGVFGKAVRHYLRTGQIPGCVRRKLVEEKRDQLKQASVSAGTLGSYSRNFKFWDTFCSDFGFPVWIDELPRARQARMVGLFAALCASEGHNKARKENQYQTFDGKMAAVVFAHKAVRNPKLDYHDPELELIAQGYKRSHVFFFLDRSSELRGPVVSDKSTGVVRTHCVNAANVILRDNFGTQVGPKEPGAMSVEVIFESHKGDRVAQGTTVRHYKSNHAHLCPMVVTRLCLNIRAQWLATGRKLGPLSAPQEQLDASTSAMTRLDALSVQPRKSTVERTSTGVKQGQAQDSKSKTLEDPQDRRAHGIRRSTSVHEHSVRRCLPTADSLRSEWHYQVGVHGKPGCRAATSSYLRDHELR
ncbi:hypothetical protein PR002_g17511 [Phytophthora rubi]|uniref:Uncharacterized protein n=1 Tax=Phytophthora rubi TaxID=129364 RepID=A0A6A3KBE4_9STRA|nr:hypothetical protein PR002_g17511 [Phytophthora rubi]